MSAKKHAGRPNRLGGLRRFALAITILNVLGHAFLGFEQSVAHSLVALATAYGVEILLEAINAWRERRRVRFLGGARDFVDFLLPAHISGLAVSMLLYPNEHLWPIAFASAVAIGSKVIFRAPVNGGSRHIFNPSNLGITVTLLVFPWISTVPPYHFTENLDVFGDWLLPLFIITSGTLLNLRFSRRLPLILAWLGGFVAQALIRNLVFGASFWAALLPATGVAFILYTFYMATDPATTPDSYRGQVVFGLVLAATYGLLMSMHIVFGLFFGLTLVCMFRGAGLYFLAWHADRKYAKVSPIPAATVVGEG